MFTLSFVYSGKYIGLPHIEIHVTSIYPIVNPNRKFIAKLKREICISANGEVKPKMKLSHCALNVFTSCKTHNKQKITPDNGLFNFKGKYNLLQSFQLRAHMYQARSLIGSDASGLSDPFARVIIGEYCKVTQVIDETLSPTWDELLIFDEILIYGTREEIKTDPPSIIIEIFDQDKVVSKYSPFFVLIFINGRTTVKIVHL